MPDIDKEIKQFSSAIKSIAETNKEQTTLLREIVKEVKTGKKTKTEDVFGTSDFDAPYLKSIKREAQAREEADKQWQESIQKNNKKSIANEKKRTEKIEKLATKKNNNIEELLEKKDKKKAKREEEKSRGGFFSFFMNEKKKEDKKKKVKKEEVELGDFGSSMKEFGGFFDFLFDITGVKTMTSTIFSAVGKLGKLLNNLVLKPIKGLFLLTKGVMSFIFKPVGMLINGMKGLKNIFGGDKEVKKKRSLFEPGINAGFSSKSIKSELLKAEEEEEDDEMQAMQTQLLEELVDNTSPEKKMLKGGEMGFMKGLFGSSLGPVSKISKMFGVGLILGGIIWMVGDFIEGYMEDGLSGGLTKAFLGESKGGIKSVMKNAGKFAMIGAGIGTFFGPLGMIIGGLAGAAIGGLLNSVLQLIKGPGTGGEKVGTAIFGGISGPMSTLFSGMKWASMGFLIGLPFGGPIGGLIGAGIGFIIGSLVNIVWQLIGEDGRKAVIGMFDWAAQKFTAIWDSISGFFTAVSETITEYIEKNPVLDSISKWITESIFDPIKSFFANIGTTIKNLFTNWWTSGDNTELKQPEKKAKKKDSKGDFFSFIGGAMGQAKKVAPEVEKKIAKDEERTAKQVQEAETANENLVFMRKSMVHWIKRIYEYMAVDMNINNSEILEEKLSGMFLKFEALNMENRMWEEFRTKGTQPSEFVSKFEDFNKKMSEMATKEQKAAESNMINSIDNRQNVINNIQESRRLKLKDK